MAAGKYRDLITVERITETNDPLTGERSVEDQDNWDVYLNCFAEVIVKGQKEFTRAGIPDADMSHIVRVPRSIETDLINSEQFRIILQDTGEVLKISDAYRANAASRQIEMLCRS